MATHDFTPTRREFLASAAGVSALGLTGSLAFVSTAMAADIREKGFYSWNVGDIEIISIYDGVWRREPADGFIKDVSTDQIKQALGKAGMDENIIPIEFAYTVVKSGGKTILVDAGTGAQLAPTAGLGAKSMAAAGITTDSIDIVLVSHFHPDHIFGLMAKGTNEQIFPNAAIKIPEEEAKFWFDAGLIEKLPENRRGLAQRIQATFPVWDNVTQYMGDQEVAPGIRSVNSFGHTAGHTSFHLSSGGSEAMLIGDVMNIPALFLANLDWQVSFDADKDRATKTRIQLVDRALADNLIVAGYHFGFPNSGTIEKDGAGHVFVPTSV